MANVSVIGAGSWGTALSLLLSGNGHKVTLWSIMEQEVKMLNEKREHLDKLPGVKLPEEMKITTDLEESIRGGGTSGAGRSLAFYQKHGSRYGSLCGKGPDHC